MASILVVEDRDSLRRMLVRALTSVDHQVEAVASGELALEELGRRRYDLILTDLRLPGISGLEVLQAARAAQRSVPVVVLTAYGTVGSAVEAMKLGASDFLEKPVDVDDLYGLVDRLTGAGRDEPAFRAPGAPAIVGSHPRLRAALKLLERVAPTESTVLLTGESGCGKELFARALHALSPRAAGPFVAVNCAAIPESLIENELFGHEKGAFTGAHRRQSGRFEAASGGTLLLDEVGELPLAVQSKVLRVLEQRTYEPIGSGRTRTADVRLVAATNRDLEEMVRTGSFRRDLFFRLDVFPILLPPLRERASDVGGLARHLLHEIASRHGRPTPELSPAAVELLEDQPWPGNVRQLANVLERAVILGERPRIGSADLEPLLSPVAAESERDRLKAALEASGGDRRLAARALGVSDRTLRRRIREHDLRGYPQYRDRDRSA